MLARRLIPNIKVYANLEVKHLGFSIYSQLVGLARNELAIHDHIILTSVMTGRQAISFGLFGPEAKINRLPQPCLLNLMQLGTAIRQIAVTIASTDVNPF